MIAAPRKLQRGDSREGFRSGADDLDEWLVKYAWQNQLGDTATTYVITHEGRVVGYYAIAMAAVEQLAAPASLRKGTPRQIPCILLARLAVDQDYRGRGLGVELLRDALLRSAQLSGSIGAAAVLVHCRDAAAREFYLHNGDFLASPVEEFHLMVPMKAILKYLD